MVGDAFIHPVKEFTVENDEGIVVLEFDLKAAKSEDHGRGVGGTWLACTCTCTCSNDACTCTCSCV